MNIKVELADPQFCDGCPAYYEDEYGMDCNLRYFTYRQGPKKDDPEHMAAMARGIDYEPQSNMVRIHGYDYDSSFSGSPRPRVCVDKHGL